MEHCEMWHCEEEALAESIYCRKHVRARTDRQVMDELFLANLRRGRLAPPVGGTLTAAFFYESLTS